MYKNMYIIGGGSGMLSSLAMFSIFLSALGPIVFL